MPYIKRYIEEQVAETLAGGKEIIILTGPRKIGKTCLLKHLYKNFKSVPAFFISLKNHLHLEQLNESPFNLFNIIAQNQAKQVCVFIDDLHYLDSSAYFLKSLHETTGESIRFIITTSSVDDSYSLIEPKTIYELKPLTFKEFLRFHRKEELLKSLFPNNHLSLSQDTSIDHQQELNRYFKEYTRYGGYPQVVLSKDKLAKKSQLLDILSSFINYEVPRLGIRNPSKLYTLLKLLAERTGDFFNLSELASLLDISSPTVENYIQILKTNMKIKVIYPFAKSYAKEITKTPKFYFNDLGIRNAVLNNFDYIAERWDRENYFKNIVFNFLSAKAGVGNCNFWRTQSKQEVDFIINGDVAFDVTFNNGSSSKSTYRTFMRNYPHIPVRTVTFENGLKESMGVLDMLAK